MRQAPASSWRAARAGDAPRPGGSRCGGSRARGDPLWRRLPTPDGTCIRDYIHVEDLAAAHWPRSWHGPTDLRTGPATGPCQPLICNLGAVPLQQPPDRGHSERWSATPFGLRMGRAAPATRQCSLRAPTRRGRARWQRATARSRRSSARPGSGAAPIRPATPTSGTGRRCGWGLNRPCRSPSQQPADAATRPE